MRQVLALLIALSGSAYAADSITFSQNGSPVTAVAAGSVFQINGQTHLKSMPMYLCLEELPRNVCYGVQTDTKGDFSLPSSTDPCNFSLHEDYSGGTQPVTTVVCDTVPKKVTFMVIRPGTGKPILATAPLIFK